MVKILERGTRRKYGKHRKAGSFKAFSVRFREFRVFRVQVSRKILKSQFYCFTWRTSLLRG